MMDKQKDKRNVLVSFIVVNWNGLDLIDGCLKSILNQTYSNCEIIFVDNCSVDGSVEYVKKEFGSVKIITLPDNRGFTGGNIEGLKHVRGQYVALVNNDAVLSKNWLTHMIDPMIRNNNIGICSSKIIVQGTSNIDSIGDTFTTAFNGLKVGAFQNESKFKDSRYFPGACAAAALYRKQMIDEIGFLDDEFYLNHEDTDLNMRLWLSGWKCLFVPEAIVHHKVSSSIGDLSDKAVYYFSRNIEWVWVKNVPFDLMMRYLPQRLLYELSSFGYFCIMKRKWLPFLRGKIDAMLRLPLMFRKRKKVQRLRKLTSAEIRKELMPISVYLKERLFDMKRERLEKVKRYNGY